MFFASRLTIRPTNRHSDDSLFVNKTIYIYIYFKYRILEQYKNLDAETEKQ